jgi:AcrR family transcriptional regulator
MRPAQRLGLRPRDFEGRPVARTTSDDPRYQRVRQRLVEAVLDLAQYRPAESISVSELVAAAGVSRAAFYGHAPSPASLLADVLIAELRPELDDLADQMTLPNADYVGLWRQIYLALLEHVGAHREVYRVISSQESSVSSALTAFFEQAASRYVQAIKAQLDGPPLTPLWEAMAITQQAHNMLSVIRAWILTDLADSPAEVVNTYLTLAPPWQLARADATGHISLRRTRALVRDANPQRVSQD